MSVAATWEELSRMVIDKVDTDEIVRWLMEQGYSELDARRMLQYEMERVA